MNNLNEWIVSTAEFVNKHVSKHKTINIMIISGLAKVSKLVARDLKKRVWDYRINPIIN